MKILFLSNLYPPNVVGGYERLCYEVADALVARGHDIMVLTSDYGESTADYPRQTIRRELKLLTGPEGIYQPFTGDTEEREAINRLNIDRFEAAMVDFAPDIVFAWNLYFLDVSLLESIQKRQIPTVFLLTDNWLIAFLRGSYLQHFFADEVFAGPKSFLEKLKARAKGLLYGNGQEAITIPGRAIFASRFMERLYQDAGFRFSGNTVIYHGIKGSPHSGEIPVRESLCRQEELRLLFAGRVVEIKGVHTTLEALPRIVAAIPDLRVRLTILGDRLDPAYERRLSDLVARLGVSDRIDFVPAVAEGKLDELFAKHDIYLFPSLYEPFSLTLIHALRAGIPAVVSDAGGNVEIVEHRQTGMIFRRGDPRSLADKVVELARDSRLRARIARSGAAKGARYTFARMIDQVEQYLTASQ